MICSSYGEWRALARRSSLTHAHRLVVLTIAEMIVEGASLSRSAIATALDMHPSLVSKAIQSAQEARLLERDGHALDTLKLPIGEGAQFTPEGVESTPQGAQSTHQGADFTPAQTPRKQASSHGISTPYEVYPEVGTNDANCSSLSFKREIPKENITNAHEGARESAHARMIAEVPEDLLTETYGREEVLEGDRIDIYTELLPDWRALFGAQLDYPGNPYTLAVLHHARRFWTRQEIKEAMTGAAKWARSQNLAPKKHLGAFERQLKWIAQGPAPKPDGPTKGRVNPSTPETTISQLSAHLSAYKQRQHEEAQR